MKFLFYVVGGHTGMKFAEKRNATLFFALCISFGAIILLLLSFHYLSYMYFLQNLRDGIIKNNSLSLNATVANYEKYQSQIKNYLMGQLLMPNIHSISESKSPDIDYEMIRKAQQDLQNTLNNSILYIDNLVYYFKEKQLILDKNGTRDAPTMFSKFYASHSYTDSFWKQEIDKLQSYHIYHAEEFKEQTAFSQTSLGMLLPILAKKEYDNKYGLIALLNGRAMYSSFHQSRESESFYMFDREGALVFSSSSRATDKDPSFAQLTGQGHIEQNDVIYLYQRAEDSGNLYIDVVPIQNISNQVKRMNVSFILLLIVSFVISVVISLYIARRFQSPLNGILQAIEQIGHPLSPKQSRIREYNQISVKIHDLFQVQHSIHQDLSTKNSLLQHYAYMSRLKMISTNITDIETAIDANRPYRLVLTHLVLKEKALSEMPIEPHRSYALITEWIRRHFTDKRPDSLTFQIEQDHILTILFDSVESSIDHHEITEPLTEILEPETPYFHFTIGISPFRTQSDQLAETYERLTEWITQRTLNDSIQVFTQLVSRPIPMVPTLAQEQELTANLNAGNESVCISLMNKVIDQLVKHETPASHIRSWGSQIVDKMIKVIYANNLTVAGYENSRLPYEALTKCHTAEEYKLFFHHFLASFSEAVRLKKTAAESDYMISFVKDYVESHYGNDISLDHLSQKLNITNSYLSAYFKEKTGINLSEYTHNLRMRKAMEMLTNTDFKIQDIASLVGYLTVAPFNRAFKRHTSATPTEFRRLQQTNK
ncbi:helix-turn-helix domain-containing protein [Paenibacillaceae bacterium]|nr:helix-turn-helix domain-containing protein [Paenibacillaceae bacterium]